MKKTKNMYYKRSVESNELVLYIVNTEEIYNTIKSVIKNLQKKYQKDIFDYDKAVIAFYHVSTLGANMYNREFDFKFTVQQRYTAAEDLLQYYTEDITAVE